MNSLADAWEWYEATRRNLGRMQRLGWKHWEDPSLESASLWRDDEFRTLEAADIARQTAAGLEPIDDLAVIVLFSVFEARVREQVASGIKPEADRLTQPILKAAAREAVRGVEEGSFFGRVLKPLKEQRGLSDELVTRVNQVRDYRNWAAHGRRKRPRNKITPKMALDRLSECLSALGIAIESEQVEPPHE